MYMYITFDIHAVDTERLADSQCNIHYLHTIQTCQPNMLIFYESVCMLIVCHDLQSGPVTNRSSASPLFADAQCTYDNQNAWLFAMGPRIITDIRRVVLWLRTIDVPIRTDSEFSEKSSHSVSMTMNIRDRDLFASDNAGRKFMRKKNPFVLKRVSTGTSPFYIYLIVFDCIISTDFGSNSHNPKRMF